MHLNVRAAGVGLAVATALGACGAGAAREAAPSTIQAPSTSRPSPSPSELAATPPPTKTRAPLGDECGPDSELPQSEWIEKCSETTDNKVLAEGSVTTKGGSSVTYPDGIKVELVRVTRRPNKGEIEDPGGARVGNTIIEVTERYTNTGEAPWAFPDALSRTSNLLYGQNREFAQGWLQPDRLPTRLMPGTSAKELTLWTVDAKDTKVLAFVVNANSDVDTDYTFTDVESLIKR